jgi:hypothetical protein
MSSFTIVVFTDILQLNFAKYGPNFIDWPKKTPTQDRPPNGFCLSIHGFHLNNNIP